MKQKVAILLMVLSSGVVINSCNKSVDTPTGPPPVTGVNLLTNSSFESNDSASLQGWRRSINNNSLIGFTHDTPNDGGVWSIKLETVWPPPLFVQTTVAAPAGTHRYQLSTLAKAAGAGGRFSLTLKRNDTLTIRKTLYIFDGAWTSRYFLDTLTTVAGDSFVVTLYGGGSMSDTGQTFFDLCKLEKLD